MAQIMTWINLAISVHADYEKFASLLRMVDSIKLAFAQSHVLLVVKFSALI